MSKPGAERITLPLEVEAQIAELFCKGTKVKDIVNKLAADGIPVKRPKVHAIIRRAAETGRFSYRPIAHLELQLNIRRRHDWLHGIDVVRAAYHESVARIAAEKMLEMICSRKASGKDEIHIGFAGGGLLNITARFLAKNIKATPPEKLPRRLWLHALVATFNDDPDANPNSFLGYFTRRNRLPLETTIVGLPAPGFIRTETASKLYPIEGVKEAFDQLSALDLIVTSAGGHWDKGCSRLHELHDKAKDLDNLNRAGCVGDLMWRPVSPKHGPIELDQGYRAMTLIELRQLPALIRDGKRVMLALAGCGSCRLPKEELLDCVLSLKQHYITDLVLDSGTANALVRRWTLNGAGLA